MKPRHIVLGAGLALAASAALFGNRAPGEPGMVSAPPARPAPLSQRNAGEGIAASAASVGLLPLAPRSTLIYRKTPDGRDRLFAVHNWTSVPAADSTAPAGTPDSTLPFTYVGRERYGTGWKVFLAHGDSTLIVATGDLLEGQYKVLTITPPTMTFEYLTSHEQRILQIE